MDPTASALQMDTYSIRARLQPALLTALPLGAVAYAAIPGGLLDWASLGGVAVWMGGAYLLAQMAREAGKRREPALIEAWDGFPTTRLLRHKAAENERLLRRRHRRIEAVTGETLPSREQEEADPEAADNTYHTCVEVLREKTRDHEAFPLVFKENCAYGFRRNLLGLRPAGIGVSLVSLAAVAALAYLAVLPSLQPDRAALWVAGMVSALVLAVFLLVVTPAWVHRKAEAYAQRLLGACETLRA